MVIKFNEFKRTNGKPYFSDSFKYITKRCKRMGNTMDIICDSPRSCLVIYKPKLHIHIYSYIFVLMPKCTVDMRGSRKISQRGSNNFIVLIDEGREDPNTTKSGPSSALQRNAIEMAFRLRADDGPTFNSGLVAFLIFPGFRASITMKP